MCVTELFPVRVPGSTVDRLRAGSGAGGPAAYGERLPRSGTHADT